MNAFRVGWLFFRIGVLNEFQYRVNFVVQLFQTGIALTAGLVVLSLVYSHTDELNGWSQAELSCVLGIQVLMGGIIKTYVQPNMTRLIDEVRDGKLDYALTKPEDSQVLVSVREVRIWQVVDVIAGLVVLGVGLSRSPRTSAWRTRWRSPSRSCFGGVLIYCFWLDRRDGRVLGREHVARGRSSSTAST